MREIRLGVFGLGVVGCGLLDILQRNADLLAARLGARLRVTKAVTAHPERQRPVSLEGITVSQAPADILDDPSIDVVVELVGGTTAAAAIVTGALRRGKAVVTANKALLAEKASEIFPLAYAKSLPLGFEAAVAGSIPILRTLQDGFPAERIVSLSGILNGTCNYILSKMSAEGSAFAEVLQEAQAHGYAEADPRFDIEGVDAAHKLALLLGIAHGGMVPFADIYSEGIARIDPLDITHARSLGYRIKLLAISKMQDDGRLQARVHPCLVPEQHQLAQVEGVFNAIYLEGDNVGKAMSYGAGAGALPTGSAVVSDLVATARRLLAAAAPGGCPPMTFPLGVTAEALRPLRVAPIHELDAEYYLRFQVLDRVGVLARITQILGEQRISIKSIVQPALADHPSEPVQVILITHRAREADVQRSLEQIAALSDIVKRPSQLIRIEPGESS